MYRGLTLVLVASIVGVIAPTAGAQSSTTTTTDPAAIATEWTRVTETNGRNIDEVGVVRTADGTLHVLWRQRGTAAGQETISHTPVSTAGAVGTTVTASGPIPSVGNPAVVLTSDGGLRTLFAGLTSSASDLDGVLSASAKADGQAWTTDSTRVSQTTSAIPEGVGAALRPDGTPVFAYAYSFVLGLHTGLDPATPDTDLLPGNQCCAYNPALAFTKNGVGQLGWFSNVDGEVGTWAQPVAPTIGTKVLAPGSVDSAGKAVSPSQRTPITTRTGTEEVFLAYCSGYPTCTQALVWKVGTTAPVTVGAGRDVEDVNLASDPSGRLWVMWEDATDHSLYAARSSDDATEFGTAVRFAPPTGTDTVWKLQGNATDDQLDVFAAVSTPGALATWHGSVLPGLTVEASSTKKGVAFVVTDAGDPVAGAKVKFEKKTVTTDKSGKATAPKGKGAAAVTKTGYAPATVTVG